MKIIKTWIGLATALVSSLVAHSANAACTKWVNNLSHCEISSAFCASPAPTPTEAQLAYYYQWFHSDTAADACKKWGQKGYPQDPNKDKGRAHSISSTKSYCYLDANNNQIFDDSQFTVIDKMPIDREWCCEVDVEGPHSSVTPDVWYIGFGGPLQTLPPLEGYPFTSQPAIANGGAIVMPSQVENVRDRKRLNSTQPTLFLSDLFRKGSPPKPITTALAGVEYCDGILDNRSSAPWQCKPQVDHIIPRRDIKGCNCGANSYKNALLISAQLNNEMSNYCGDENDTTSARNKIIAKFRIDPFAANKANDAADALALQCLPRDEDQPEDS